MGRVRAGFSPLRLGLLVALAVVLGVAVVASLGTWLDDDDAEVASAATSAGKNVKVVIAGTNDALEPVTDGGISGRGNLQGHWRHHGQRDSPRLPGA